MKATKKRPKQDATPGPQQDTPPATPDEEPLTDPVAQQADQTPPDSKGEVDTPAAPAPPPKPKLLVDATTATLELELAEAYDNYNQRHIDMRLTEAEAQTFTRIKNALIKGHETLDDGRHVDNGNDTIRWLMQEIKKNCSNGQAS